MSRIALLTVLTMAIPVAAHAQAPESILASYRTLTAAEPDCGKRTSNDEIFVCGRRDADRYRVPFTGYEAGDPRGEKSHAERRRLQHITTPCQDRGPFLVGCGMVGVSVGIGLDGTGLKRRELAP